MNDPKHVILFLLALFCMVPCAIGTSPTRLIYRFPREGSWFENAAVRRNGSILLTSLQVPGGLHSLNPFDGTAPVLISKDFDGLNSTLGIVETVPDTFYILASNFSLDPATLGTQPRTNNVYKAVFRCGDSKSEVSVLHFMHLPHSKFVNGLTKFNDTLLLVADSGLGAVWSVNVETETAEIVAKDPLMFGIPANGYVEGINGVHFRAGTLYFSNSQKRCLAKMHLDKNGKKSGPVVKIATPQSEKGVDVIIDDFAVDRAGRYAYAATEAGNTIQRIDLSSGEAVVYAGDLNTTAIAQPTSAIFGRTLEDQETLYALTAGGLAYPVYTADGIKQVGAQVVAVDTKKDRG